MPDESTTSALPEWLVDKVIAAVQARAFPKTCCPSEIARALNKQELEDLGFTEWREAMPVIREVAWTLQSQKKLDITQKGEAVDAASLNDIKGPIRLRQMPSEA